MDDIVARALAGTHPVTVTGLADHAIGAAGLLPHWLQDRTDVHGSHGLFYWLRARSTGVVVQAPGAALVLSWRPDVGCLVAWRPVGERAAIAALLETVAAAAERFHPGVHLVARYLTADVAAALLRRGWGPLHRPWQAEAPIDDETYPEVIVTAPAIETPAGQRYKPIRQAIAAYADTFTYTAAARPLGWGEDDYVTGGGARASAQEGPEGAFNRAVAASLTWDRHECLTFHYLTGPKGIAGFAATADVTGIAHGYFLACDPAPRLATYFLWLIYLQQRRSGAAGLNLGGSEARTLFDFKTRTFPDHQLQTSTALQYRTRKDTRP